MTQRTTTTAVQALLDDNYNGTTDLQQFVDMAASIVDWVVGFATRKNRALTAAQAELIERNLSAHYYTINDPLYTSKSTGGASGSFQGRSSGEGFARTSYGQSAIELDTSGGLIALSRRAFASTTWVGKPPSEQIPINQRD